MKKTTARLLALVCAMLMIVSFVGCSSSDSDKFVGTWTLTVDMTTMPSMTEAEEASTVEYLKTLSFVLKLKGDGSATATGTMMKTGDMPAPAGWTAKGDTVILGNAESSDSSQKMVLTLKDGKLFFDAETMGEETAKYFYLQKQ